MPSPIGHSLMGFIVFRAVDGRTARVQWLPLAACLFAANAPDLDFVPGLLLGQPGRFHHGPSHSVVAAFLFGGLLAAVLPVQKTYYFGMGILCYLSHVLLDFLIDDPSFPFGVPLFWPFSDEYYMAALPLFRRFEYSPVSAGLISTLFSFDNLLAVVQETLVLLPLLGVVSLWRRVSSRMNDQ